MSHHLVTVCMFCLLCAAHTCGSHIDIQKDGVLTYDANIKDVDHLNIDLDERRKQSPRYHQKLLKIRQGRSKRETKINPDTYIKQIFRLYGDASTMTMNLTGFNRMLDKLQLDKLIVGGQKIDGKRYFHGEKEVTYNVSY